MRNDRTSADVAFINGSVYTADAADRVAEAVFVRGKNIEAVGTTKSILALASDETRIVDLRGRSLLPGFIDTHYHIFLNGFFGDGPDAAIVRTHFERCRSVEDILALVREAAATKKPGEWISMMGYDQNRLAEQRHPTREELDAAAPDNPVQCMRTCGHVCVYNSLALAAIGVHTAADAARFPDDEIVVEDGKLTGMVKDHTHFEIWSKVVYTEEQHRNAAAQSNRWLLEKGITSIHDAGETDRPAFHLAQKLKREGVFKPKVYMMLHSIFGKPYSLRNVEHFLALGLMTGLGDEQFRIGSCKFMIDGGSSGPSCATRAPYSHDPTMPGILGWTREEVADYLRMLNEAECQATAHAVGDLAIEFMIEGYERAFATRPRPDLRHRIEHCMIVDENLVERMAKWNICPSVNPGFIAWNGANYTKYYGDRMKYFAALRTMIDYGVNASIGSDAPSGPLGSMEILDACVNRIDRTTGEAVDATQAITIREAIRLYTMGGAYSSFEEEVKGSIETGKRADLIVLSDDILSLPSEDILSVRVEQTWIDGVLEFERTEKEGSA